MKIKAKIKTADSQLRGFGNKQKPNLPYVPDEEPLVRINKERKPRHAINQKAPANNQHLIDKEKEFKEKLPSLLRPAVDRAEEFYLGSVARSLLSLDISTDEATSVLERSLDSQVNLAGIRKILETALHEALSLQAVQTAIDMAGLNAQQANMLKAIYFLKTTGGSVQGQDEKLLSELLKVLALPGQAEGPSPRVQQAPETERPEAYRRTGRSSNRSRKATQER